MRMSGMRALALAAALACANVAAQEPVLVNTEAAAIVAQQRAIRAEAEARTGRYRDMDERTRTDLFAEQDKVFALLEGRERSDELSRPRQVALFNSLERISAIVNQAEDDRLVCRRERSTGTFMVQNVCKTVAELRARQQRDQAGWANRDIRCETCGEGDSSRPENW